MRDPDLNHSTAIRLRKQMVSTLGRYNMLQEGDRVLVAVSGGKDSSVLLSLLNEVRRRAPFQFTLEAALLDQKQPGFDAEAYSLWVRQQGVAFTILEEDTYSIVKEKTPEGKSFCSVCSRLRRGILYNYAHGKGYTKVALGHHRDDAIETLLLNVFFSGQVASMPPKLKSDDGRNILIRPLAMCLEADIEEVAHAWQIPVMPCNLCGSQDGLKRKQIKAWLSELKGKNPFIMGSLAHALQNVRPSQLYDDALWDFEGLEGVSRAIESADAKV